MHTGPIPMRVVSDMTLRLVVDSDHGMPIACRLTYSPHEPLTVTATFRASDMDVKWVFARDLLELGLHGPAGEGDVCVWPAVATAGSVVCISLHAQSGHALLEADTPDIEDFLKRSFDMVPQGSEGDFLDLDGLIGDLLGP